MDYTFIHQGIPHYYGDKVRTLFVCAVLLGVIGIPIWGDLMPFGTTLEIIGGIVLVGIAGFMHPHSPTVMGISIVVSSFGAFLFESSAILLKTPDTTLLMIGRQLEAVLFLVALYFSVKTLRAMSQKKIGEVSVPWEFEDEKRKAL